jgi:uncharacterized CHY-type Zn-finger protein
MEEVLKGLQGKTLTKKKLFDFLADINLESFTIKKETVTIEVPIEVPIEVKEEPKPPPPPPTQPKLEPEIKCAACVKTFATDSSLKRHHKRNPVCLNWITRSDKTETKHLIRGIHLLVNDILEKAISINELQCKFCKSTFTNTGNHHKHFNTATVCNRLAFQEFKKLFNNL